MSNSHTQDSCTVSPATLLKSVTHLLELVCDLEQNIIFECSI